MAEININNWEQPESPARIELVFADRFKEYGAYEVRSKFRKNQFVATMWALGIAILASSLPVISNYFFADNIETLTVLKVTNLDDVKAPDEKKEPEPPPPKIPEPPVATQQYVVPKINPETTQEDVIIPPDEITNTGKETKEGSEDFDAPDLNDGSGPLVGNSEPATNVQVKAKYPGGEEAFREYVANAFQYPVRCQDEGINGSVVLRFAVDETGRISRIQAIEQTKSCPEFTDEAIRVLKKSPRWIPGQNNGVFLKSWREIPIKLTVE